MISTSYVDALRNRLHPSVYQHEVLSRPAGIDLLLTRVKKSTARYAFAVANWNGGSDGREFLNDQRNQLAKTLSARWGFREVGLYLVVCGDSHDWRDRLSEMRPDRTGFHALIVQGVHFIQTGTCESMAIHSSWGPVTFGNSDIIENLVDAVPISC